jgi:hypothetical protein
MISNDLYIDPGQHRPRVMIHVIEGMSDGGVNEFEFEFENRPMPDHQIWIPCAEHGSDLRGGGKGQEGGDAHSQVNT